MTMTASSFIDVSPTSHFPIQNLPYGVFSRAGEPARVGVALGDFVVDLAALEQAGLLTTSYFQHASLNPFLAAGRQQWTAVRRQLLQVLAADSPTLRDNQPLRQQAIIPQQDVSMHLPVNIGDYTDFYSSRQHAFNVGSMFREPDKALFPNWLHMPVGYHGRASSVVVSGTPIRRPNGQTKPNQADGPQFGPSGRLDFELEMGFFIGPGNALGQPISTAQAADQIFGLVLVNDWSARDIQKWEYVPLGPFLAKNLATSISPWVVPLDALAPFRTAGPPQIEPEPLPYLQVDEAWSYDIHLEVLLETPTLTDAAVICRSNYKHLYWNMAQQLAHHTVSGCNMRPGDLLASGTISGDEPTSYGSMLELAWQGSQPIALPNGETRTFLEDGDTVIMTGYAQGDGYRIGFGEVRGTVVGSG